MQTKIGVMMAQHCDPWSAIMQKRIIDKYWASEVDNFYIMISGRNYLDSALFIKELWGNAAYVDYNWDTDSHGICLDLLYKENKDEIIMTLDSDYFILRPGIIKEYGDYIKKDNFDVVASFADSGSQELLIKIKERFADFNVSAARMNPHITLSKRRFWDNAPKVFCSAKGWQEGDYIEPLEWTCPRDPQCTDTFGYMGMQIMNQKPKIKEIPLAREGVVHPSSLSCWVVTFSQDSLDLNANWGGQELKERFGWWWMIFKEMEKYYPFPEKNKEHEKLLLSRAKAIPQMECKDLDYYAEFLLNQYPELKNL